ncbi:hypothetical protein MalM25_15910 [Planctomycetes bacterium MalM25]|nr:hypothetical protein MalM25_15910 [Planctomycetes bacterium MalM25]
MGFPTAGQTYEATVYYDDPAVDTRTHVGVRRHQVTSGSLLQVALLESGEAAVWIQPIRTDLN